MQNLIHCRHDNYGNLQHIALGPVLVNITRGFKTLYISTLVEFVKPALA